MLHVIMGPPAAGKTTFARENAVEGDIIIDLDHLANTLAGKPLENHEHTGDVLAVAKAARQAAISAALTRDVTVWLIHTNPSDKQRAEYKRQGAEFHEIDPGKKTVMARCKQERPHGSAIAAAKWYDERKAKPTITIESFGFANGRPNGGLILDARDLPNPHDIPALRVPNGQSERVCVTGYINKPKSATSFKLRYHVSTQPNRPAYLSAATVANTAPSTSPTNSPSTMAPLLRIATWGRSPKRTPASAATHTMATNCPANAYSWR